MADWKDRLYGTYVSSQQAQASTELAQARRLNILDYPQFRRFIEDFVPADRSSRIADLGCGHGPLIFCLRTLGYTNVEGVDVSPEQVALAEQLGIPGIVQGGIADFLKTRNYRYNVVFLMDVLEHLTKQELIDLLDLVRDALAEGGRVIIHVPNAEGLHGMRVRYGDLTHQICFTPQSIRQVLLATRFRRIEIYEDKPIVHGMKSALRRILWNVLTARERLLLFVETGANGHILSQNMLVVAAK